MKQLENGAGENAVSNVPIAIIGAGKMGALFADSLLKGKKVHRDNIRATVRSWQKAKELEQTLGIPVGTDNRWATKDARIVLLCVKPPQVRQVLEEISPLLRADTIIISIATAVSTASIESSLSSEIAVVRAMPNTACRIGKGMTALSRGRHTTRDQLAIAEKLFGEMGQTAEVDESLMDAVTGLSASGPAFVYVILEALAEGGTRSGLPRDLSMLLAAQATLGAASMVLATGQHPAVLKGEVLTPGGCTIDGILELEDGKIRATLIRAVATAAEKARRMSPKPIPQAQPASSPAQTVTNQILESE